MIDRAVWVLGAIVACVVAWTATRYVVGRRDGAAPALPAWPPAWTLAIAALAPILSRPEVLPIAVALGALNGVTAGTDARMHLIYNATLVMAFVAIAPLTYVVHGWLFAAVGLFVGLAVCSIPYRLAQLHAGDWKLVGLVGLAVGPRQVIFAVAIGVGVLGVWALIERARGRGGDFPFAPALALGSSCALMVR